MVTRPLWQWIFLAILPGLASDVFGLLGALAGGDAVLIFLFAQLAMPLIGLFWLIRLGRAYVADGLGASVFLFVFGYGCVNALLWGAGCALILGR